MDAVGWGRFTGGSDSPMCCRRMRFWTVRSPPWPSPRMPGRLPRRGRSRAEDLKIVSYVTPLHFDPSSYLGGGERYPLNLAKAVTSTRSEEHTSELQSLRHLV